MSLLLIAYIVDTHTVRNILAYMKHQFSTLNTVMLPMLPKPNSERIPFSYDIVSLESAKSSILVDKV
jgi:hypothetical protein